MNHANRFNQAFYNITFIVNWKLDRDAGPIPGGDLLIKGVFDLLMVLYGARIVEAVNQHEKPAIHAIGKQGNQSRKIDKKPKILKELHFNRAKVRMNQTSQVFFKVAINKAASFQAAFVSHSFGQHFFVSQKIREDLTGQF